MASISFFPSQSGQAAVKSSDFEGGFQVSQSGNVFNFNGEWSCPLSPVPQPYTQNLVCICEQTADCAVITATFTFNGTTATITGSMTVSKPSTPFGDSGIAALVANGGGTSVFPSSSQAPNTFLSAAYLLGHLGETTF